MSAFGTRPLSVTVPPTHFTFIRDCRVLGSLCRALRTRVARARSAKEDAIGELRVDFIRSCPFCIFTKGSALAEQSVGQKLLRVARRVFILSGALRIFFTVLLSKGRSRLR